MHETQTAQPPQDPVYYSAGAGAAERTLRAPPRTVNMRDAVRSMEQPQQTLE